MRYASEDGRLMIATANYAYLDFALSWVSHVRKAGVANFAVVAMDDEILRELQARGVPAFAMPTPLHAQELRWGSGQFFARGRRTVALVRDITACGVDLLLSDVDVAWLRNPYEFIDKYPLVDVLVSTDSLEAMNAAGGLEPELVIIKWDLNIGMMHFTSRSTGVAAAWSDRLEADHRLWDQAGFNQLVGEGRLAAATDPTWNYTAHCEAAGLPDCTAEYAHPVLGMTVGVLPASLF